MFDASEKDAGSECLRVEVLWLQLVEVRLLLFPD